MRKIKQDSEYGFTCTEEKLKEFRDKGIVDENNNFYVGRAYEIYGQPFENKNKNLEDGLKEKKEPVIEENKQQPANQLSEEVGGNVKVFADNVQQHANNIWETLRDIENFDGKKYRYDNSDTYYFKVPKTAINELEKEGLVTVKSKFFVKAGEVLNQDHDVLVTIAGKPADRGVAIAFQTKLEEIGLGKSYIWRSRDNEDNYSLVMSKKIIPLLKEVGLVKEKGGFLGMGGKTLLLDTVALENITPDAIPELKKHLDDAKTYNFTEKAMGNTPSAAVDNPKNQQQQQR